jgi:hypothetical protein
MNNGRVPPPSLHAGEIYDCSFLNKKHLVLNNTLEGESLFALGRKKIDNFSFVYTNQPGDFVTSSPPVFADAENYNLLGCFVNFRSFLNNLLPYTLSIPLGVDENTWNPDYKTNINGFQLPVDVTPIQV